MVDSAVIAVENRMHNAILTEMDNAVIPRVEMAVKSITKSSGRRPSSAVQMLDQRDFGGNIENTPLISASSKRDLNVDQDRNDKTLNVENFGDGDFPAL